MSAMKEYSLEQRMYRKFHRVYDGSGKLLGTIYKNKTKEERSAFEYGFEMGMRQGYCLGLQEAIKIIKSKRG
jgi:hypothetical protein